MAYLFSYGAYMLNRGSEVVQDSISNPARTDFLQGRSKYLNAISGASFGLGYLIFMVRKNQVPPAGVNIKLQKFQVAQVLPKGTVKSA